MPWIDASTAALLAKSTVRQAILVELQFASRTTYIWNGAGRVRAAGQMWSGVGEMGGIQGLQQTREPTSDKVTLSLSGVSPEILSSAKNNTADVQGRPCIIRMQLFGETWQPVGAALPLFWGTMQRIKITRSEAKDLAGGTRVCSLEVENPFADRSRAAHRRYTDADQQAQHPGDRFCRWVSIQRNQSIVWPDF
jgi:hypothetical protein